MKIKFYIIFNILILSCCIFSAIVLANDTILSIDIKEIAVSCSDGGSFFVDGEKYNGDKSFFRQKGDSIEIKFEKDSTNYQFQSVNCDTENIVLLGADNITIENIQSNAKFEIVFRPRTNFELNSNKDNLNSQSKCDGGNKCPIKHFEDIDTNEWYHEDVDYVVLENLMNGVADNKFSPHNPTTRAMIVTILYRLENEPNVNNRIIFADVEDDKWYTDAIAWANEKNIVLGYGNDNFGPHDNITREQMVTILYRYAKYKKYNVKNIDETVILAFKDVDKVSEWAYEAMKWACSNEIIKGIDDKIKPQNSTERCQIAAILHRFCEEN